MFSDLSIRIDAFVEAAREHWRVPGVALAIVRRGGPVHQRGYGVKSATLGNAANLDTAFAIGSCSKAFTATLAAILVDDGKLAWDDPIRKYLPDFRICDPWISDHITIRDVLANRTGLSRSSICEYGSDLSRAEVIRRARDIQPIGEFRDQFTYCNLGFVVAAEAMAAAAGAPFPELMQQRVFTPLGMRHSTVHNAPWATHPNIAEPHGEVDGAIVPLRPLPFDNLLGAGSNTISAADAAAWLALHLHEGKFEGTRIVSRESLRETHIVQSPRRDRTDFDGYGMGWNIRRRPRDCLNIHEGAVTGFRALTWFDPEDDWAGFVSINTASAPAHAAISAFFRTIRKDEEPKNWITYFDELGAAESARLRARFDEERENEPISSSRWELDHFAGSYRHQGFGTLHVERRADHLWFHIDDYSISDGPLVRYASLCFEHQGRPGVTVTAPKPLAGDWNWVRFHEGEGRIASLDWHSWFGEARFTRQKPGEGI